MDNKLQVLENRLPLKAYDEKAIDEVLNTVFKFWLANLLSIKADNEDKLDSALPAIKKHFWSLGLNEVQKAFTMYADGELEHQKNGETRLKPIPNYFDTILVGQIFKQYKLLKPQKVFKEKLLELEDDEKRNNEILSATICFDYYVQNGFLNDTSLYLYKVLTNRFEFSEKEEEVLIELAKNIDAPIEEQRIHYKKMVLRRYFDKLHAKGQHLKDVI